MRRPSCRLPSRVVDLVAALPAVGFHLCGRQQSVKIDESVGAAHI